MRKVVLEMGFNAFSGLHGGLVLFEKIYLNPRGQYRSVFSCPNQNNEI
jgi:hypothetical protein